MSILFSSDIRRDHLYRYSTMDTTVISKPTMSKKQANKAARKAARKAAKAAAKAKKAAKNTNQVEEYAIWLFFIIFGCITSTDTDVLVVCDSNNQLSKEEMSRLHKAICDLYQNDIDIDDIDIVRVTKTESSYELSKGGSEIFNMVVNTWNYHPQTVQTHEFMSTNPFSHVLLDFNDDETRNYYIVVMVRTLLLHILKHLEFLTDNDTYSSLRDARKNAFHEMRMEDYTFDISYSLAKEIMDSVIFDEDLVQDIKKWPNGGNVDKEEKVKYEWKTQMKSLTLQMLKLFILYTNNVDLYSYVKPTLAENSHCIMSVDITVDATTNIDVDILHQGCLYYMMRGTDGDYSQNVFPYLRSVFLFVFQNVM